MQFIIKYKICILLLLINFFSITFCSAHTVSKISCDTDRNVHLYVSKASVKTVLQTLAQMVGQDVIISEQISGTITADFDNITPESAIYNIVTSQGLVARKQGNSLLILGKDVLDKQDREVRFYPLSYMNAEEIAENLKSIMGDGCISAHMGTNTVIVKGTPSELICIEQLIPVLDKPEKQTKVEAEVLAINKSDAKELGITWDFKSLTGSISSNDSKGKEKSVPEGYGGISYGHSVNGNPYTFLFRAKLHALITEGKAKILAKPNVVTLNGRKAKILIGSEIPVLVEHIENGVNTTTIEYKEAGISLSYTPIISKQDEITAKIEAEVSTPYLEHEMKAYRIVTRKAQTMVRVKSGECIIIGGLIDKQDNQTRQKVPILGDIPILGKLFQSNNRHVEESEIIIAITAEVLK